MTLRTVGTAANLVAALGSVPATQSGTSADTRTLASYDPQVNELLSRMTVEEKIGQMTQADQEHIADPRDVETYFLGSVLNGGNSDPKASNHVQDWADMYDRYRSTDQEPINVGDPEYDPLFPYGFGLRYE